jgi:hypothetical protein
MPHYWATFRVAAGPDYNARYNPMVAALEKIRDGMWAESISFWAFGSGLGLDNVLTTLSASLDPKRDLLVVGQLNDPAARYFGNLQHIEVFKSFFPNAQKFG